MEKPTDNNKYRFARARANRIKGLKISNAIDSYLEKVVLIDTEKERILKYREDLRKCSSYSLFRRFNTDAHYLHSLTCKHKLCPVCNAERKTRLRMIYRKFFEKNADLLTDFDFMHLTLTVPHTEKGWKDSQVYNKELLKTFNLMRKYPFWKEMVYGGEATVEFTRDGKTHSIYESEYEKNGLHIHIHALLLVRKQINAEGKNESRNKLYSEILKTWNHLTYWQKAKRKKFSESEKAAIRRSICGRAVYFLKGDRLKKMLDDSNLLFKSLVPEGSTFVNLENLYVLGANGKKFRCSGDLDKMMKGIMECLKYHFEPLTIYSNEYGYDIELIQEMLPVLYKQRLYVKFGTFYGNKSLNINFEKDVDIGEIEDSMNEEIINLDTGTPAQSTDFQYQIHDLSKTYLDARSNKIRFMSKERISFAGTFTDAFAAMKGITKDIVVGQSIEKRANILLTMSESGYQVDTETGEIIPLKQQKNE